MLQVMVDCAREYLSLAALKQYVVLCRLFKLNHLHLHLTDSDAFTFPSTTYPQLAAKSKFRYVAAFNTKGYSSTYLAMGFAYVRAGTQKRRAVSGYPPEHERIP